MEAPGRPSWLTTLTTVPARSIGLDVVLRIATSICTPGPDTSPGPTAFVEIDFTDDTVMITPSAAVAGLVKATGLRRSTLPGLTVDSTSPGVGAGTAVVAGGGATVAPDGAGTGAGGGGSSAPVQPPVSRTPTTLSAATTAFTRNPGGSPHSCSSRAGWQPP